MESERVTRRERIDPKLRAAGWNVVPAGTPTAAADALAIEEFKTTRGPADYVLCERAQLIGVVEAKKLTVGSGGVLPQAERYARAIPCESRWQGQFGVPFLYSTNGERIRFHDVRQGLNLSRWVSAFHTPRALREMLDRDFDTEQGRLRRHPVAPDAS